MNPVRKAMPVVGLFCLVGVAGALWTTRFLDSMLFGVTSRDPFTLVAVVVLFCVTALSASYVPARPATLVDPVQALRAE